MNKCKCNPQDLQPFGECICGGEELFQKVVDQSHPYEDQGKNIFKRELTNLIEWLQKVPSTKQFYGTSPELLLQYYLEQRKS